ncbi:MAG: hypothetical protein NC213_07465 [Acetobacter sp.]|nr:hypothetical protein [Bacteroides sp.]MCM1341568.1 hypothetical protein [Acetobacter sp.]MCM1433645.1 hypothetical protein [Clostridiales bacterium]
MSSIINKIKSLFIPEAWCCAVRFNDNNKCIIEDVDTHFTVLKDSYRYWTADPFLFKHNGKYFLFFEVFDRLKRKGLLGYREIFKDGYGDMKIIYESPTHLSYPFIYEKNNEIYIVPESNKSGELFRLKCIDFPDKWEKDIVLCNEKLADTTLLDKDGVTYYITEKVDDSNIFDRLDIYFEEDHKLVECKNNPVKKDINTARCAGKLFYYNDMLIRPSQDCGESYGKKLNFNEVISISENGYEERLLSTVNAKDIKLDVNNDFVGIHTYNSLENIEVIDLKIKGKFNILNTIGAVLKQIKRVLGR